MLEDADAPVLLTQEHLLDVLPDAGLPMICLDRDWHDYRGRIRREPSR